MCLAQGPQRNDAGEARTRGPSASSQALYHWATALPLIMLYEGPKHIFMMQVNGDLRFQIITNFQLSYDSFVKQFFSVNNKIKL